MVQIRHAVLADVEALSRLATTVFRDTYGAVIPEEVLATYLARVFAPSTFSTMLTEAVTILLVASDREGAIGGYCKLVKPSPPHSAVELVSLYVDPRKQGRGFGKRLMQQALTWAATHRYTTMQLAVWQENQRALRFYRQFGFTIVGKTEVVVGGIFFSDWIMQCSCSGTTH